MDAPNWNDLQPAQPGPVAAPQSATESEVPEWDNLQPLDDKFGGLKQTALAALEGAGQGMAGPLAPIAERIGGIKAQNSRGRASAHPIAHGIGEVGGFLIGALTGTGEAALMSKAGEAAAAASGIGKATYAARVGSEAVKQAAEMAVMSGGDEIAKRVIQDPDATVQNAIAHVGLMSVLGAGGGAFMEGAVSPLWKATAGPKVEALLNATKNYLDGGAKLSMGPAEETAAKELGITLDPVMRAGMSNDVKAGQLFSDLRRSEHAEVLGGIDKIHSDISHSVANSMGMTPESIAVSSENTAGHELKDIFQNEVKAKYDPRAIEMQARDAEAAPLMVSDEARLNHAGKMIEDGIKAVGTDSPYFKEYQHYSERLLSRDSIGDIDKLRTEIMGKMKAANRAGDDNTWKALHDIRTSLGDFQTNQIEHAAIEADKQVLANTKVAGLPRVNVGEADSFRPVAQDLIERRRMVNQNYAKYAETMDQLMAHLGIGEFKGTKGLVSKLTEKLSPEELLKKFTIKGNSDLIPYMQEHFPETFAKILENERKQLIRPAVLAANKKGEVPIDVKKLSTIINDNMSKRPEYIKAVLPDQTVRRVEAGRVLANAIPAPRDSGTPAGMARLFRAMPANAVAAISWAMGHGVLGGMMAGEMAQRLGKDAPEAIKLAYLKFLSAEQPVKAEGFKAMVDMLSSTYKGENMLSKATANVFKPGIRVLTDSQMPSIKELDKLDKLVAKNEEDPNNFTKKQSESQVGHYLPNHQMALTQTSTQALQYLQNIKPKPFKPGTLDKEIPPTKMQEARYNRALEIAQQPASVLQHVKDGTLQITDMQDLQGMYPALYKSMAQKLTNEIATMQADDEAIPYKTKLGMSLFLGQPLDNSMQPMSILNAQPKPAQPTQQPEKPKGSDVKKLGKDTKSYRTPEQAAEYDKASRD